MFSAHSCAMSLFAIATNSSSTSTNCQQQSEQIITITASFVDHKQFKNIKYYLLEYDAVKLSRSLPVFWRNAMALCPGSKNKSYKQGKGLTLLALSCLLAWFILWFSRWRQYMPSKCWWSFTRPHSITSQKTLLFIPAVRTWNLTEIKNIYTGNHLGVQEAVTFLHTREDEHEPICRWLLEIRV